MLWHDPFAPVTNSFALGLFQGSATGPCLATKLLTETRRLSTFEKGCSESSLQSRSLLIDRWREKQPDRAKTLRRPFTTR
jgi:hypothetical protein